MECLFFITLLEYNIIPMTICPAPLKTGKNGETALLLKTAIHVKKPCLRPAFP